MAATEILLPVRDYDLAATLDSGQVFRWQRIENSWHGVIGKQFVRLTQTPDGIHAETAAPVDDWNFLREFLQTEIDLSAVLKTFPDDEPMRRAVASCRGLRLLRQDPWECLASFILVFHQANRPNPADRRAAVRTFRRANPKFDGHRLPLPFFSHSAAPCRRDGTGTARMQNGLSRAQPAGRRAANRRRHI